MHGDNVRACGALRPVLSTPAAAELIILAVQRVGYEAPESSRCLAAPRFRKHLCSGRVCIQGESVLRGMLPWGHFCAWQTESNVHGNPTLKRSL
jgi:hypothetical protein